MSVPHVRHPILLLALTNPGPDLIDWYFGDMIDTVSRHYHITHMEDLCMLCTVRQDLYSDRTK
jgi:hypothetical protein